MAITETQVPPIAQPLTNLAGQTRGPDSHQGRTRNRGPLRYFPGAPVITKCTPDLRMIRAKEGLSSSHDNFPNVPLPLRRGVLGYPLQNLRYLPWPSPNPHRLGSPCILLSQ